MKKVLIFIVIVMYFSNNVNAQKTKYPYQNSNLSVDKRVDDLFSRINLDEIVG